MLALSHDRQGGPPSATTGLMGAVDRLRQVVDLETQALRENQAADLQSFNHRKNHGLLEVTRGMRALAGGPPDEAVRHGLLGLRAALAENRAVLRLHLQAVQEISAIVAQAMEEAESDGTYSAGFR